MKEETKFKLKKHGKRAGFGLALVSLFVLGVGVGACSARKAVGSSAEDISQTSFEGVDLLSSYGEFYSNLVIGFAQPPEIIRDNSLSSWAIDFSHLRIGQYVIVLPSSDSTFLFSFINNPLLGALSSSSFGPVTGGVTNVFYQGTGVNSYFLTIDSDTLLSYDALYLRGRRDLMPRLYLVTEVNYYLFKDSVAEVTLPTDFNPIWLYGDAYKGAVYGMLSTRAEGMSYTASLDVKFLSGGNLYDGIYFEFDHLANTWYQEPTSGEIVLADRNANNYHYPTGMYYRRFGQSASVPSTNPDAFDCVWSPQWGLTNDSEGNTHKYLTPTGAFASDEFRVIDVKEYDASTPVSARWPNLDALALLRLKSSGFIITGDTNLYDAFELLGGAFRSVSDILNIQILPFMTLGMLFFIPLIVLVLFAIIRILNK